jgi:hypothetical protein
VLALAAVTGCSTLTLKREKGEDGNQAAAADAQGKDKDKAAAESPPERSPVAVKFLLSMDYSEAKAISAQSLEIATGARIAADSIEVLKKDKQDRPIRVRAKGKVYLETGTVDEAKILCQEVYITDTETVVRGRPIMQRGGSIVEGLEEKTVFYLLGTRLRVIGLHRLTNERSMVAAMPHAGPWTQGPNPLLPALTEGSVPANIRTEMQKAAEAEAVLQQTRLDANRAEAAQAPQKAKVLAKEKAAPAKEAPSQKAAPEKSPKAKKTAPASLKS